MGGIKRLCLIVFGLAGVLCLAALALPWIGPFQREATALLDNSYYFLALEVAFVITAFGVLIELLRGLFTPRQSKTVIIDKTGGDQITVSTAAISSQATHVVERAGRFAAERVRVSARKNGNVRVDVRVRPLRTVDVSQEGRRLHDALAQGLATICGDRVRHINLQFVEAEQPVPAEDVTIEIPEVPTSVLERAQEQETTQTSEITVPLGRVTEDDTAAEPFAIEGEE